MAQFGELLTQYLEDQGRTAVWLAKRLKMSEAAVAAWKGGVNRPGTLEVVLAMADALDIRDPIERADFVAAAGYAYLANPTREGEREVPYMPPPLPLQGVIGRDKFLNKISQLLEVEQGHARDVPPIALQGLGGIGKTTLAIALGRRTDIRRLFPDGVLWAMPGPNPVVRPLLNGWGRILNIDLNPEPDELACQARLRSALHERRVLFLIDDIWDANHGRSFNVAGPFGRTLFTTREPHIAYELATQARTLSVNVLDAKDALALLRSLAPTVVESDPTRADRLCQRLEYLPLALTLAGRLLASEEDVPSRVQRLLGELIDRREARLQLIQSEGRIGIDSQHVSLQAILGMSVDRLNRTDQGRFAMLSVFGGEPLTWDLDAVKFVWECSQEAAEDSVASFVRRGLIERREQGQYWTHALLADYAEELRKQWGL